MTLYESNSDATVISMSEAEEDFLKGILSAYPLVANENRQLTRNDDHEDLDEDTELLRTSIEEINQLSRKRLSAWLAASATFRQQEEQRLLTVKVEDIDWLLTVLNDLRIGSWQQLDCPSQEDLQQISLNADTFRSICTMELSGMLQTILLSRI